MKFAWVIRNATATSATAVRFILGLLKRPTLKAGHGLAAGLEGGDHEHQGEGDQAHRLADLDAAVVVLPGRDQRQVGDGDEQADRGRR